ncbi:MAG: TolC family protein [Owenweeksia sp.]
MFVKKCLNNSLLTASLAFTFTVMVQQMQAQVDTNEVETSTDSISPVDINILDYLPPLTVLIDSALTHAPEKDYYQALIESAEYDVVIEKKSWARDIRFIAGYNWSYGNQVIIQGLTTGGNQINEGYNYGIGLTVPLSSWYGRQDRIKRAEAVMESQEAKYNEAERQVRERVIETYNELLLLQRLLNIISEAKESSRLISDMAEERFRDGELSLDQLGQTAELKARYASEYEQLRTQFSNAYTRLERMVGVPFSKFKYTKYTR